MPRMTPMRTFLAALPAAERAALLALCTTRVFEAGTALMRESEAGGEVFVLTAGWVKVIGHGSDGHTVLLAMRTAGDLIGELGALDGRPRSATVLAAVPTTAQVISARAFVTFLDEHPEAARLAHSYVREKLRMATRYRVDLGGARLSARIARILLQLASQHDGVSGAAQSPALPLSQADLAALVGATEASVHRLISDLRRRGVVSTGYRTMRVENTAELVRLAEAQ